MYLISEALAQVGYFGFFFWFFPPPIYSIYPILFILRVSAMVAAISCILSPVKLGGNDACLAPLGSNL